MIAGPSVRQPIQGNEAGWHAFAFTQSCPIVASGPRDAGADRVILAAFPTRARPLDAGKKLTGMASWAARKVASRNTW